MPPDPSTVASPTHSEPYPSLAAATAFLYTGRDSIQTGVIPGSIDIERAAVLRGKVTDKNDVPLAGVNITIKDHPEFGQTYSRADGAFDLAINGGGHLTVNYQKTGYLPSQRLIMTPWRDFVWLPDVALVQLDSQVTTVDLASAKPIQHVKGSRITDSDGARQAILLIGQGTSAQVTLPDGTTTPISKMNVRATEYTVGANGPNAMPGQLPPTTAYTYAVELSADEAIAAGAATVTFSKPLYMYVDDFLGFPVGSGVPAGYYDRQKGQWLASDNGRVVKILSITEGKADLDVDGTGSIATPSSLALLNVTDAERAELAALYPAVPKQLWRVPIQHFTPWDCNWPYGPPPDAVPPPPIMNPTEYVDDPCYQSGSLIECENGVIGEKIDIKGTPFSLNYRSSRTSGYTANRKIKLKVAGETISKDLLRIHLEISVAGRQIRQTFPAQPNQTFSFTWDGCDAFGRTVGSSHYTIRLGYEYRVVYYPVASEINNAFSRIQGVSGAPDVDINRLAATVTMTQEYEGIFPGNTKASTALPYWSIDVHHSYDYFSNTVYLGSGKQKRGNAKNGVLKTIIKDVDVQYVAVAPDGTLYYANEDEIFSVSSDGATSVIGESRSPGITGDGGPASSTTFGSIAGIAVGPDGSIFVSDAYNNRVYKIAPDGIITTVAGNGYSKYDSECSIGDGGPATSACLSPEGVAVAGDGTVYISDTGHCRVRKVGTDGLISTIAGNGRCRDVFSNSRTGDGGPAIAGIESPSGGLAVSRDGSIYYADAFTRVRKVGTDGIVRTVAGTGVGGDSGDGGAATAADIYASEIVIGADGSLYISGGAIRKVTPDGFISTYAGGGLADYSEGRLARSVNLGFTGPISITPDGTIFSTGAVLGDDVVYMDIFKIVPAFPNTSVAGVSVPSDDGSEVYVFDYAGKHIRTLDAMTGSCTYRFHYNDQGLLTSITDSNSNVTVIERDPSGAPIAIIAPFGQRTSISLDGKGYVGGITSPSGESHRMTSYDNGLLSSFRDPTGATSTMEYDQSGFLVRDSNAEGGFWDVVSSTTPNGRRVYMTSAMHRTTTYLSEQLGTGDLRRTISGPTGAVTSLIREANGIATVTAPDGSVTTTILNPDPRFGMMSPLSEVSIRLPSGLTKTRTETRNSTLSDPANPLSLASQITTTTVNGRAFLSDYDTSLRQFTYTTPVGRKSGTVIDYLGRPVSLLLDPTLKPVTFKYDGYGFLATVTQGRSSTSFGYDGSGRKASATNALNETVTYGYDAADRVNKVTLPSGRAYWMDYNANGQMVKLTMPNGNVHGLDYTLLGMDKNYTPPGNQPYSWLYNLDKEWTQTKLPSGRTVEAGYDNGGRPTGFAYPEATVDYLYATGNPTDRIRSIVRTPPAGGLPQEVTYSYDGPLVTSISVSGVTTGSTSYTYDNNFLLSSINLTSGSDTFNSAIKRDDDGLITKYSPYDYARSGPGGAVTSITDLTMNLRFGYDDVGRISSKKYSVNSEPIFEISYTYDPVGRIATATEIAAGKTQSYEYVYDPDGQLKARKESGAEIESYTYDVNGNRTGYTRSGPVSFSRTASFDAQDRLVQQGGTKYTYDVDGYLTSGGHLVEARYSAQGELLSATTTTGHSIGYSYDGLARRVARHDQTGTYQYFYTNPEQPFQLSAVRDPDGTFTAYYYDPFGNIFAFKRGTSTFYVASDHLGTPRVIADSDGTVVDIMEYDSYGSLLYDNNPTFKLPIGFAGGIVDTTGLIRFGFRDYEPASGRWMSRDPILYDSNVINLYQYSKNNPVILSDRDGRQAAIAIPVGLPFFVPPESVFVPGSPSNKVFVESAAELLHLLDPAPLASFIADGISKVCRQKEVDCDSEIAACTKLCSQARGDSDMKHIWGGAFGACMRGCVSKRCGGN